jgi:hypothetical protein
MINLSNEGFAHRELFIEKDTQGTSKTMHHPELDSSLFGQICEYLGGIFYNTVFDTLYTHCKKIPDSRIRTDRKCGVGEI